MTEIVGVRFQRPGKLYYFDSAGIALGIGDSVVVETAQGLELGQVVIAPAEVLPEELDQRKPVKPVLRRAEEQDVRQSEDWKRQEEGALLECRKLVTSHGLPMKVIAAEYNFDGSRLILSFSAEKKVDFRGLVRELSKTLKTKVHLRQIGPREETKALKGVGRCGRVLCCANFLHQFDPVSIKMAKEQDLPLNPAKISGVCGRLLCCLAYENELYRELKSQMPKVGQRVSTPSGQGNVVALNILKETVVVELETQASQELPAAQVRVLEQVPSSKRHREKQSGSTVLTGGKESSPQGTPSV
jgi:cell fate regulator YaaT (PSP1 superfamily)